MYLYNSCATRYAGLNLGMQVDTELLAELLSPDLE